MEKQVGPPQVVPEGFAVHSPMWYLNQNAESVKGKTRRAYLAYWAEALGLTLVALKDQLRDAK